MKSNIMQVWEALKNKLPNDYNFYSTTLIPKMEFPAIILTPSTEVPSGELASYRNFITEYQWQLIVLFKVSDYEFEEDKIIAAIDDAFYLSETIPNLLGVKILESIPFGHYQENKELMCIEMKVKSKI